MASVYLAELETEIGFRRKVALKVVRNEFAKDSKFIALMSREAMIGSLLQHPNIVQTLEFNEADGRCFLALEYVEGETLEEMLNRHRTERNSGLPIPVALEAMVQVLKGLGYAHSLHSPEGEELGIVHRDLKPGNIMLSRHGMVKVMDFGIAKARIASANITTAGQVRGTPIYMAPEQVTGKPLDGRADQFAAATVLYELLTGNQLFIANNLVRIMQRVARAEVDDQVFEIEDLHPKVAPVLARMWSKKADDRFDSCDEPARLLEDIVFELKSAERAMRASGEQPSRESLPPVDSGVPASAGDSTFFDTVGNIVRKIFAGTERERTPPPRKRKRKRKRKRSRAAPPSATPTATAPSAAQIGPAAPVGVESAEVLFDDQVSEFGVAAIPGSEVETPPVSSTPNIAAQAPSPDEDPMDLWETAATPVDPLPAQPEPPPRAPLRPGPPPGPMATPPPAPAASPAAVSPPAPPSEPAGPEKGDGGLDPFFYENFDK